MVAELLDTITQRARVHELGAMELLAAADRLKDGGEPLLAAQLYRDWIEHHPDDALLYVMAFNLGVLLSNLNDAAGAKVLLQDVIRLKPDFLPASINLGFALERLGDTAGAVGQWYDVINRLGAISHEALGHKITTLRQLARVLETAQIDGNAEEVLWHSLQVAPQQRDVLQHWLSLRQRQCKWPVAVPLAGFTRAQLVAGMSPLALAAYTDDPLLQLANAADYSRHDIGRPTRSFVATHRRLLERGETARLRVGYLSSDLRAHAIGYLMAELFEVHDRSRVEVFAYYCGHEVDDALHRRIKGAVDHWVDISAMTDTQAAERIVADEIAILVDVNGYTHGARTAMLAMRPAPVIVNWLGYPNTTGSPYHAYIIADAVIIPSDDEIYYSETVKRLTCYQPNDRKRVVASEVGTRAEAGLPDDGTVFCCFNGAHKITPFTWRRWMEILRRVPGSVLWLIDGVASTNARLLEHAEAHGIASERVVFARKLANPWHLARYSLADLFLDTSPYGAHTTGSDALWMGVPVLTIPGRCFASRVCASLVTAAGLPDLVCNSSEDYVERAVALGTDRAKLAPYRDRLRAERDRCVLFDTELLAASVEALYREMWSETLAGECPRPDLSNVELYGEIGAELDSDAIETGVMPDYRDHYMAKLAERDAFSMMRADTRLWSARATP